MTDTTGQAVGRAPAPAGKARLVDVAKLAGVSPKTVSNYMNGFAAMSPETRDKVRAAVDALGYVPNLTARNLRRGRMGTIAIAVPRLGHPYFAELASLVTDAATRHGMTVIVEETGGVAKREENAARGTLGRLLDGVIISPLGLTGDELASIADVPMVLLGENEHPAAVPYVGVDNVAAAGKATRHLIDRGYQRIAAIGAPSRPSASTARLRLLGFRQEMRQAGAKVPSARIKRVEEFSRAEGARAMWELLQQDPTPDAVFCFSDVLAFGALCTLGLESRRVPEDVAVLGWDDVDEAQYSVPPLSSVTFDTALIAETAVDLLLKQIRGEVIADPEVYVPTSIHVRRSS